MLLDIQLRCESWLSSIFDFYDPPRLAVASALAKRRRKLQFVAVLVTNTTANPHPRHVRVKLHAVLMPHRQIGYPPPLQTVDLGSNERPCLNEIANGVIGRVPPHRWNALTTPPRGPR